MKKVFSLAALFVLVSTIFISSKIGYVRDLGLGGYVNVTSSLTVNGNTELGNAGTDVLDINGSTVTVNGTGGPVKIGTSTTDSTFLLSLDGSNRRLGVNINSPAATLDVAGSSQLGSAAGDSVTVTGGLADWARTSAQLTTLAPNTSGQIAVNITRAVLC